MGPLDSYSLKRPFPIPWIPLVSHKSDTDPSLWPLRVIPQSRFLSDRSSLQEPIHPHPHRPRPLSGSIQTSNESTQPKLHTNSVLTLLVLWTKLSESSLLPAPVLESLQAQRMLYLLNQPANRHPSLKLLRENIRGSTRMSSGR